MSKYKYYFKTDKNKEAVGTVEAKTRENAILKAATKKDFTLYTFQQLFEVEKIKQ